MDHGPTGGWGTQERKRKGGRRGAVGLVGFVGIISCSVSPLNKSKVRGKNLFAHSVPCMVGLWIQSAKF